MSLSLFLSRPRNVTFFFLHWFDVPLFGWLWATAVAHDTSSYIFVKCTHTLTCRHCDNCCIPTQYIKSHHKLRASAQTRLFLRFNWETNFLRYHFFCFVRSVGRSFCVLRVMLGMPNIRSNLFLISSFLSRFHCTTQVLWCARHTDVSMNVCVNVALSRWFILRSSTFPSVTSAWIQMIFRAF